MGDYTTRRRRWYLESLLNLAVGSQVAADSIRKCGVGVFRRSGYMFGSVR